MVDHELLSIILGSVGAGLVLLLTLPSAWRLGRVSHSGKLKGHLALSDVYQDKDGTATEDSEAAFSDKLPKIIIYLATLLGFAASIASAVLSTIWSSSIIYSSNSLLIVDWIIVTAWAFILVQAFYISVERSSILRFTSGGSGAASVFILLILFLVQNAPIVQHLWSVNTSNSADALSEAHLGLGGAQFVIGLFALSAFLSLPRRPVVFVSNGRPVDAQFTTTAYSRYTWGWCLPILRLASRKTFNLEDLPRPDHFTRAQNVQESFNYGKRPGKLFKLILTTHYVAIANQISLTFLESTFGFAPQVVMLNLLRLLELRTAGENIGLKAWGWAIALGLALVTRAWLESWMNWVSLSRLLIPIRAELSALIFQKAMRKKDVKEVEKSPATTSTTDEAAEGKPKKEKDAESKQKPGQSTINLISVDTKRVSDFSSFFRFYVQTLVNFCISLAFIVFLIGWIPLLTGLACFALIVPANILVTRRYSAVQKKLMKTRDEKTAVVTEALRGMRQIKFSALENQWQEKIGEVRERELGLQWRRCITETLLTLNWNGGPLLLSSVALSVYAYLQGELTPSVAFTTLGVFNSTDMVFSILPHLIVMFTEAKVSLDRIQKFVDTPDKVENLTPGDTISFQDASLAWPTDNPKEDQPSRFVLRNIDVTFPPGELSVISGETGSGKSLMLSSILGECDLLHGVARVPKPPPTYERYDHQATPDSWIIPSSIAFVAQIPWIENATLKDNILFGLPFDANRYKKTLSACSLEKDIEMLIDGDMTEIGANGINLSGGQRWRVTLARAFYSRAGILVLDDIFSAVDAHVGRWIFENALTGELGQGRTRILATHHAALCISKTKYAIQLGNGTIMHAGNVEDLKKSGSLTEILHVDEATKEEDEEEIADEAEDLQLLKVKSAAKADNAAKPKKFVEDEHREKGRIKKTVYLGYFKVSGGLLYWILGILIFLSVHLTKFGRQWWLKVWTSSYQESATGKLYLYSDDYQHPFTSLKGSNKFTVTKNEELKYYLSIYFALGLALSLLAALRKLYVFSLAIRGSRTLFKGMSYAILRTPLRWIDTVPVGRILNRFTADFNVIDGNLANDLGNTMDCFIKLTLIMVSALFVSPIIILFGFILIVIAVYFARFYLAGAREAKRLESIAKSPIFEQLGSALVGLGTIRAFDKTDVYYSRIYDRIDDNSTTSWMLYLLNRWLSYRLSMIGAGFTTAVAILIVGITDIDASLAGFALFYSMDFSIAISFALRFYTSCELDMNAAERVLEYTNLAIESQDGMDAPAAWPSEGRLTITDLEAGYADDLPAVLKGLSFSVEKNQRVGIVGRTGAGKSSLALALFRFLKARQGSISIDGLDISKLKLFDLRSRLAIIPQDPTIFSGTVRSNLDAFDQSTDAELKEALQRVHLIHSPESRDEPNDPSAPKPENTNINIFNDLSSTLSDGGLNLSQGQRQLLCLARAILARSKIMVLDEATSAVDMDTDVLIQRSIREEFQGSTLLVIAHRLSTVADFDKILVMSDGKAEEFGTPRELLKKKGAFWAMVTESGDRELLERMILGEQDE